MNKRHFPQYRFFLLLAPITLFCQYPSFRSRPAEPSVEFTSSSNASQAGADLVMGYQFTVRFPVVLTSLGAVLQGSGSQPVFGALPASMPVSLWDEARNLLITATVSASDPLVGHFNYAPVAAVMLTPGVRYTIAGLVPKGRSVLSDVPALVPGSAIVYGGPRSFASRVLAFPPADQIGHRGTYFGASFLYTGGTNPVAIPGRDRKAAVGTEVTLDGSGSFAPSGSLLEWEWLLISVPRGSAASLSGAKSATPSFVPDRTGLYVAQLTVAGGSAGASARSKPSTVSITVAASDAVAALPARATGEGAKAGAPDGGPDGKQRDALRQAFERTIYALHDSGNGTWHGQNREQRLTLEFDAAGAQLKNPNGSVDFHLTGYGYGERLRKPEQARLTAMASRLEYRRGDLTEWYVNGSGGLEQGFTFTRRPAGDSVNNPLTISLGVGGDLTLEQQGDAVMLRSGKGVVLSYAGLSARDAGDRALPSRLEARNHEIRLVIDDREARYPLVIDPTWTQQQELAPSTRSDLDSFGRAAAIDGATAVIGAPGANNNQGAAWIFVQTGGTWNQQGGALTAADGLAGDQFGTSVAISGGTVLIGSPNANSGQGAAYVFVQSGSTWNQETPDLTAADGQGGDNFGTSVALSGVTALIGSPNSGDNGEGSAYIFMQGGDGTWSQLPDLYSADGQVFDNFGTSVALSGGTALIGAPGASDARGTAYVFMQSGSDWNQQGPDLEPADGQGGDNFGTSVALSGVTALIGSPNSGNDNAEGSAYIFMQGGDGTWSQQGGTLSASDGGGNFGSALAVSGGTAVIGAWTNNSYAGSAYVFVQSGSVWSQTQELIASDTMIFDQVGHSVAMSGGTALIGDTHSSDSSSLAGTALIFTIPASISISATHSSPTFQVGPGDIALTVANAGGPTLDTDTVSDTIDPAFTINSASAAGTFGGCSVSGQAVTCTMMPGAFAASNVFNVYVTAAASAASSISNTAMLADGGVNDAITAASSTDTIAVTPEAPQVDTSLTQIVLSGSTDNGTCSGGSQTMTATDQLQNISGSTLTNPYAVIGSLTGGNSLLSQSADSASVAPGDSFTFTFHIQLATCNTFQLFFDVRSN